MYWIALACLPIHLLAWYRARPLVKDTSLTSAWNWAAVALLVWVLSVVSSQHSSGVLDHLGYASAVLLLAPFIAVLGARRPGAAAWNWFVVLPMIVVLLWPAVSSIATGSIHDAFELPTPMALGVVLVMVMGLGNYFGTRFTLPVLVTAAGPAFILRSLTQSDVVRKPDVNSCIWIASVILGIAAIVFLFRLTRPAASTTTANRVDQLNRMWIDFQERFGVVWSKRVMDRLNQFADRERWPFTFALEGIKPTSEATLISDPALARIRWVLRRFVDPAWLNLRVDNPQAELADSTPDTIKPPPAGG